MHSQFYCKHPKYSDTQTIAVITRWVYQITMHSNDADGMANSVDPDQTAPLGAV